VGRSKPSAAVPQMTSAWELDAFRRIEQSHPSSIPVPTPRSGEILLMVGATGAGHTLGAEQPGAVIEVADGLGLHVMTAAQRLNRTLKAAVGFVAPTRELGRIAMRRAVTTFRQVLVAAAVLTAAALPYAISTGFVTAALGVALLISQFVDLDNISLVFLAAVLASAARYGAGPSVFTALLSVLCYDFFLLPPLYTFTIADPANVVALFFFMIVALLTSSLTARTRAQAVTAQLRAKTMDELCSFSKKLAVIVKLDDLLWVTAHQIASMLKVELVLLTPEDGTLALRAGFPLEEPDPADLAVAKWCWDHNQPAGRGAATLPGAKRLFMPLRTVRGAVGVLGINRKTPGPLFTPDERRLLDALADQAAVAIERTQLAEDINDARVLAATERLRSSLLTWISHDLRTPLASIMGTITSLRTFGELYDDRTRDEMLATAQDEGERLNRFVANLLDMTRLDSGAVELLREIIDLSDVVGSALRRCETMLAGHRVAVELAPDLPMFPLDFMLMEQVLINLVDNAAKYAPEGSAIEITGQHDGRHVVIEVRDEGPGIPVSDLERVFDKFYRVHSSCRQRAGTGLGLAICRGFIEAHGGTIVAANRPDRSGTVFAIRIPVEESIASAVQVRRTHAE
jgi:two-component system, OmpR family, sensor histidine kinase KdpD